MLINAHHLSLVFSGFSNVFRDAFNAAPVNWDCPINRVDRHATAY